MFGAETLLLRMRHLRRSLKDEEEDLAKLKGGAGDLAHAKPGMEDLGAFGELKGVE